MARSYRGRPGLQSAFLYFNIRGRPFIPMPKEIVPLLSGVLARRSILAPGGFSLTGLPGNQQIVRQHPEADFDPCTLQAPAAKPTQPSVGLGIREPQFHRLTRMAVPEALTRFPQSILGLLPGLG